MKGTRCWFNSSLFHRSDISNPRKEKQVRFLSVPRSHLIMGTEDKWQVTPIER